MSDMIADFNERRLFALYDGADNIRLTESQKRAVLAKGNIIVSAAAGSGKTSTMIKRILLLIAEGASLKNMLVLVYNNAAADELKARLHQELFEKACRERSEARDKFRRELDDLPFCHICTIHAFCQSLIRENFDKLGLSPTFEVLDEQAHRAYMNRALDNVIAEYSQNADEEFCDIAEIFLQARKEDNLKDNIVRLHNLLDIQPDRDGFLQNVSSCFDGFEDSGFTRFLTDYYKGALEELKIRLDETYGLIARTTLTTYAQSVANVLDTLEKAARANDCFVMGQVAASYEKINARRSPKATEEEKSLSEIAKVYIGDAEDVFGELAELSENKNRLRAAHEQNGVYVRKIMEIVCRFDEELARLKRQDDALSFEDLQHCAAKLLDEYPQCGEGYDAVFVDEYQDVNPTQEFIISRLVRGECFMVGDIKQSIYGFRLADPTIFLSRQAKYKNGDGTAIDFNRNFRSAKSILSFVNGVFDVIMTQKTADVDYKHTARFELDGTPEEGYVQLHLFAGQKPQTDKPSGIYDIARQSDEPSGIDAAENEGRFIANEIRTLVGRAKGDGGYIGYGDVAVLFRNRSQDAQKIVEVLKREGIPVDENGFSKSVSLPERELICFLQTLDNPRQDIPLAGFLLSFFGGYNEEELARIAAFDGSCFYDKLLAASSVDDSLGARICNTLKTLEKYRIKASFKNASELMGGIVGDFSYDAYLMRFGESEVYGLKAFMASSSAKDAQSLGRFLEDYSELDRKGVSGAGGDRVHISTFHGYKGLEIPIVFVSDTAHAFNPEATRGDLIASGKGFIGMSGFDFDRRVKYGTLSKIAVAAMLKENMLKEEMRLLYVALTRAKQIMYITASVSENKRDSFGKAPKLFDANCDLDFISNAVYMQSVSINAICHAATEFESSYLGGSGQVIAKGDPEVVQAIREAQNSAYRHGGATKLAMKYSVSALDSIDEQTVRVYEKAAAEGTAYHKAMQYIDLFAEGVDAVTAELDRMLEQNLLTQQERDAVDAKKIAQCLDSSVIAAAREALLSNPRGCLREQSFMMYKPANEVSEKFDASDGVLVQGIIDMLVDGKQRIIVDFKNSALRDEETVEKYKKQLYLYKMAVESAIGVKIDRTVLYSFKTGRIIDL